MSTRLVALLRGVNVGGKASLEMAALRELLSSLGYEDVVTYVQSGNAVFGAPGKVEAATLERAIKERFGLTTDVVLRTAAEMRRVVERNPFPDADTGSLHVGFMTAAPPAGAMKGWEGERFVPEEAAVVGSEIYFHLPNGMGRAKLPPYAGRRLGVPTTVRNWRTVTKLIELADS